MPQETQRPSLGDDGRAHQVYSCGQEPKLTSRPGRCGAEAVAHVRPSPCLQGPNFLPSSVLGHECAGPGLGSVYKAWLAEKAVPPSQPQRAPQSSVPVAHWHLQRAVDGHCDRTYCKRREWVLLPGQVAAVRRLEPTPAQEEPCGAVRRPAHLPPGPRDQKLFRPQPPLLPAACSVPPSLPAQRFSLRGSPQKEGPGLACQSCPLGAITALGNMCG